MCGIVGLSCFGAEQIIEPMTNRIVHRGPDNQSTWSTKGVGLGHSRLSIIDTSSTSNQPFWDTSNRFCIVFNGEIYNFKELRSRLESKGIEFITNGDTEVLLYSLITFGESILCEIEGIFAFCLYDSKKNSFLLGRDKFGVKPLYYYHDKDEGCFLFASEFKAFLEVPSFRKDICYDSLFRTMVFLYSPGNDTLFKYVKKLPAASLLRYEIGKNFIISQYWEWPKYDPNAEIQNVSTKVEQLIDDAVKRQLISDVPIAAFLSGGIDSSLICSSVSKFKDKDARIAFSINSKTSKEDGFDDDLPYAKLVANSLNFDLNVVETPPSDLSKLLYNFVYQLDEINADPAALNVLHICELAREKGIKVLLSGTGGDDLFSGYRRHQALLFEKYWANLPKSVIFLIQKFAHILPANNKLFRRLKKLLQFIEQDTNDRLVAQHYWSHPDIVKDLFANETVISKKPMQFIYDKLEHLETDNLLEKSLLLEREYFLRDHNLQYTDKMSMATGVEVRVPFLDTSLVEFVQSIPSAIKMKHSTAKFVLKKIMEKRFSNKLAHRSKTGFGVPLRYWIKNDLSSYVADLLSEKKIKARGIFAPEAIQKIVLDNNSGKKDFSYLIFALLCVEIWFQIFVDEKLDRQKVG